MQETLVKAWSNIGSFVEGTNLPAWLFTILRNIYYSEYRKRRREVADPDGAIAGKLATAPAQNGHMDMLDFHAALQQLPNDQREALILIGASGLSYEEAAGICGCAIGTRPVDLLIMALDKLGAEIAIDGGYVIAKAPGGLKGAAIDFPKVTVSGTHVALMAATLAKGTTVITSAACEPEVQDVADCLNKMGARISGAGTSRIVIEGVAKLHGARHTVLPDRIETGTYAMAVAMTGGDVQLNGARPELLQSALDVLTQAGAIITVNNEGIRVARNGAGIRPVTVSTAPFPGFPTDLQAQLMALMICAKGSSHITETIFENRFMHVQELARFGARIHLDGETATIHGIAKLRGAPVMATDLRASVSLVIAGLAAEGETMVNRVYHLDRGFERLEEKLSACGASIERISD
ncbi:UDP-N-acetylglucosamine 1-carboxyvinyltransferase [mine drainage metagenome]|uniref:UDP-N-acetylglucosamine 1-carboxyvinyltransferase n=1 Tax=mine drainage metagenome TaxID=410659 RepID=A0A1J5PG64_9ZZZZ